MDFTKEVVSVATDAVETAPSEALVPLFNCIVYATRFQLSQGISQGGSLSLDALLHSLEGAIKALTRLMDDSKKSSDQSYMLNEICGIAFQYSLLRDEADCPCGSPLLFDRRNVSLSQAYGQRTLYGWYADLRSTNSGMASSLPTFQIRYVGYSGRCY